MPNSEIETEEPPEETLEGVGEQLGSYERQLRTLLQRLDAKVDSYRFSIEKGGDGIVVDLALRTTIKLKRPVDDERDTPESRGPASSRLHELAGR
jgi:hypothetical protein